VIAVREIYSMIVSGHLLVDYCRFLDLLYPLTICYVLHQLIMITCLQMPVVVADTTEVTPRVSN
jgi:hypothetical protein